AVVAKFYNRPGSVLGVSNVLSSFESHRVPFVLMGVSAVSDRLPAAESSRRAPLELPAAKLSDNLKHRGNQSRLPETGHSRVLRAAVAGPPWSCLHSLDVVCLQTLRALADLKAHRRALFQGLVAVTLDGRKVHENVVPAFATDKSVAFGCVKPLHCTLFLHALRHPLLFDLAIC